MLSGSSHFLHGCGVEMRTKASQGAISDDPETDLTDDQERDLVVAAAVAATSEAFACAQDSDVGACVVHHGWIVRIRNGVVLEYIKPRPLPIPVTELSFRLDAV